MLIENTLLVQCVAREPANHAPLVFRRFSIRCAAMTCSYGFPQHYRLISSLDHLRMARREIRVGQTVNQKHRNV